MNDKQDIKDLVKKYKQKLQEQLDLTRIEKQSPLEITSKQIKDFIRK